VRFGKVAPSTPLGYNANESRGEQASLENTELLATFKEIDIMPEKEQGMILHYINAYIRDFKTRKAHAS